MLGRGWGDGEDSGLGHGAGLLLIDVAAHATGVDAWKNQRYSRGWVRGTREARRGPKQALPLLRLTGSHCDSSGG